MIVGEERQGPVATGAISRPEAGNAVDCKTADALTEAFIEFECSDAAVAVPVMSCSGWALISISSPGRSTFSRIRSIRVLPAM
ncbi:hypothetical protein [Nonomuraea sp. NPDC049709]|uniref:hypothetical protein n=1 Tax=Nonomuraea sp. NPDC049709 TaxID=3154736 RepID=UPI00342E3A3E